MGTPADSERTRARIIAVAGQLFAEHGWRSVAVREIAALAETHLSAINYHFTTKEKLYEAVLQEAVQIPEGTLESFGGVADQSSDPKQLLIRLVEGLIVLQHNDAGSWKSRLIIRECIDPTPAFKGALKAMFTPLFEEFRRLLEAAVGFSPDPHRLKLSAFLLLASIDSFTSHADVISYLLPDMKHDLKSHATLAADLVEIFLGGLRGANEAKAHPKKVVSR